MNKDCGTCKHWQHDYENFLDTKQVLSGTEYYVCGKILLRDSFEDDSLKLDAFLMDGSNYHASLFTPYYFSCSLWECKK